MIKQTLQALKREFKPYTLVTLAKKKPYKGTWYKKIILYNDKDLAKYKSQNNYVTCEYVTFESYLSKWLDKK